jgi:hypothetical protein
MIDVKKFVAVGGISGVHKLIAVRQNGLIIENFDTKERRFVHVRQHEFSPFETISIYTSDGNSVPLAEVMTAARDQFEETPPPSEKSDVSVLRQYFGQILPNYDRDRVHTSDIKKFIKWFTFLQSRDLLKDKVEEPSAEETSEAQTETNSTE